LVKGDAVVGSVEAQVSAVCCLAQVLEQAGIVIAQHHARSHRPDYLPNARRIRAAAEGVTRQEDAVAALADAGLTQDLLELCRTSVYVTDEESRHGKLGQAKRISDWSRWFAPAWRV